MDHKQALIKKIAEVLRESTQLEDETKVEVAHVNPIDVETRDLLNAGKLEEHLLNKRSVVEKVASLLQDQLEIITIRHGKRNVVKLKLPGTEYGGEDL